MIINNCEVNILINGRATKEFQSPSDFQHYVEGRHGSEFEIEFVNNTHTDVEAILSIDGLSVTDGKAAGDKSSGYMIKSRERLRVPGWTVDGSTAARFTFSGKKDGSYVEKIGGDALNKGVIGCKVYARKVFNDWRNTPLVGMRGFVTKGMSHNASSPMFGSQAGGGGRARGGTFSSSSATLNNSSVATDAVYTSSMSPPVEQSLGTDFGVSTDFNTTKVDFERGDIVAVMALFYDDLRGLRARGIDPTRANARPNAFPADEIQGATPPAGWVR